MSATHPDGSYSVAIEEGQLASARLNRAAKDQAADNGRLIKRIDEVERIMAQIQTRLDALESLADAYGTPGSVMIIDQPIPYTLPEVA